MIITKEEAAKMREALIDASPLSDRIKWILKDKFHSSLIHSDVVRELVMVAWYGELCDIPNRLTTLLELLGEKE